MNDKRIDFIVCTNNSLYLNECCKYLEALELPEGMTASLQTIEGAASMTSGYNYTQTLSDAKYRVYLHQDVFITNKNFIYDLLNIFRDSSIGMLGLVGSPKLPESAVMWEGRRVGSLRACNYYKSIETRFSSADFTAEPIRIEGSPASGIGNPVPGKGSSAPNDDLTSALPRVYPVECADGLLLATQYDLPWREDIFDGWDFYDVSQGFEFRKAGYRVVVPDCSEPWAIHDDGVPNYKNYDKYKEIFIKNYR